jgi:release factor glutamine methyltransferase
VASPGQGFSRCGFTPIALSISVNPQGNWNGSGGATWKQRNPCNTWWAVVRGETSNCRWARECLIPRQETELLVELALSLATPSLPDGVSCTWADLGTGSGCLAISLARALPQSLGVATDISSEALALARVNADGAGLSRRIEMRRAHWWKGLEPWWGKLALVVANPPYIPSATVETLEPVVRLHEPLLALDGGLDGLVAIRQVVEGAREGLAPGGVIVLEHHHDQSEAVCALLEEAGLEAVASHRDLEGTLRFASARRRGPLPYM